MNESSPIQRSPERILTFGASLFPSQPTALTGWSSANHVFYDGRGGNLGNSVIGCYACGEMEGTFFNHSRFPEIIPMPPEEANERFDRILVIAANWFSPAMGGRDFSPYVRWFRQISLPVTVMGLGQQMPLSDVESAECRERYAKCVSASFVELLHVWLDHGPSIACRGNITKELLRLRGIPGHCIVPTGCPTWFVNGEKQPEIQIRNELLSDDRIAIHGDSRSVGKMLRTADGFPHAVYVIQSEMELIPFAGRNPPSHHFILRRFSGISAKAIAGRNPWCYCPTTLLEWECFLRTCSFSFGKRIHGTVCAIKNGVPAVVICHDGRIREFVDLFRIPSVSPGIVERGECSVRTIWDNADYSEMNRAYPELLRGYREYLISHGIQPKESPRLPCHKLEGFSIPQSRFSTASSLGYLMKWAFEKGKKRTKKKFARKGLSTR